jgi:hypothetical protein
MREPETAIIAVAGFVALFVILLVEGHLLMADPRSAAFETRDSSPAHSDSIWRSLSRAQ